MKYLRVCLVYLFVLLQACAHSEVSREAQSQVDKAYTDTGHPITNFSDGSNAYQNTNQKTKGLLIGGATGAIAGGMTSMIGVIPGAATGAILGGAFGAYIDSYTTLTDQLENRHINVIALGDQVMIIVPSNQLFEGRTSTILSTAYSTLDLVAQLINSYPNMSVQVAAYTSDGGSARVDRALSLEQANQVVKYLWRRKVDSRMLYAIGGGSSKLVSQVSLDQTEGPNYRVEITLEKLPL